MSCFDITTNLDKSGCFKVSTNLDSIGCFKVGILNITTLPIIKDDNVFNVQKRYLTSFGYATLTLIDFQSIVTDVTLELDFYTETDFIYTFNSNGGDDYKKITFSLASTDTLGYSVYIYDVSDNVIANNSIYIDFTDYDTTMFNNINITRNSYQDYSIEFV